MFAQITRLCYWKSEHDETTCEDAYGDDATRGLFAVADGAGTTLFSNVWARTLIDYFLDVPLLNSDPFEVEWWLRQVQEHYKAPHIENTAWNARQKMQDQGSHSTLATLRVSHSDEASTLATLLVFGDSCILINKAGVDEVSSFPLEGATEFDRSPICLPSKLSLFHRHFHTAHLRLVELAAGDRVILATDAVSRWIVSAGDGFYHSRKPAFEAVFKERPESWPSFIRYCRKQGEMVDDDSTALLLALGSEKTKENVLLGQVTEHRRDIRTQRAQDFQQAMQTRNKELAAIYYGDSMDISQEGICLSKEEITGARQVADALSEVLSVLRRELNSLQVIERVGTVWHKYADLLSDEPSAATLRQTLQRLGVITSVSAVPAAITPEKIVPRVADELRVQETAEKLKQEHEKIELKQDLLEALLADDDEAMVAAHQAIQESLYSEDIAFSYRQLERILLARQHMKEALKKSDAFPGEIDDILNDEKSFAPYAVTASNEDTSTTPQLTEDWIEKVSLVKLHLLYRLRFLDRMRLRFGNEQLKEQARFLLANDLYIQDGIYETNQEAGYMAIDPELTLTEKMQEFQRALPMNDEKLLMQHGISDDEVKAILLLILRSELFEKYLSQQDMSIYLWLEERRQWDEMLDRNASSDQNGDYHAAEEEGEA